MRAEVEGAFGLKYKGYLLFFGAIEPKKNVGRLIEAYLASGIDIPLVIIGSKAWKSDEELRLVSTAAPRSQGAIREARATDRVFHFDYAPVSLLVSAIRGARATIFPSLYEGFGLPVLESMVLGTPVVTSREGATAEIAGAAALLVNPYDPAEIASAMRLVTSDHERTSELAAAGKRRAEMFSASQYASRVSKLYGDLMDRPVNSGGSFDSKRAS